MKMRLLSALGCVLVGGVLGLAICTFLSHRGDALACSTEFNFIRNQ